jgi:hypothetical protein
MAGDVPHAETQAAQAALMNFALYAEIPQR